jgi:putative intracellular protease/amidase
MPDCTFQVEKETHMKILMVLTSHDQLGATGRKTGFWLEEFAAPYYVFQDAGAQMVLASPKGGHPPMDPASDTSSGQTEATRRFKGDGPAQDALAKTVMLSDVKAAEFDAVFYPGGHGPLWDLTDDVGSIALINDFHASAKPIAAVCHAPAIFRYVKVNGVPFVEGKRVTGFSNTEEVAAKLDDIVPFLLEDELKRLGGRYEKGADWQSFTIVDGHLITGQNPASSFAVATELVNMLQQTDGTRAALDPPEAPLEAARAT